MKAAHARNHLHRLWLFRAWPALCLTVFVDAALIFPALQSERYLLHVFCCCRHSNDDDDDLEPPGPFSHPLPVIYRFDLLRWRLSLAVATA